MKIEIKYNKSGFLPCPEYSGVAKIVDKTELKEYNGQYGKKQGFRYIFEINQQKEDGSYWTVCSKPFTPTLHEKGRLRAFIEKVNGRKMTDGELEQTFDADNMLNKYVNVVIEHDKQEDGKVYSNIALYQTAKEEPATWQSNYVKMEDKRPTQLTPISLLDAYDDNLKLKAA